MIESPKNFIEQFQNFIEHIAGVMKTFLTKEVADNYYLGKTEQTLTTEQKAQVVQNLAGTFLPLSGGTMNGRIIADQSNVIGATSDDQYVNIDGGTFYDNGASLTLYGKSHINKGLFQVKASDGTNAVALTGTPDGHLTWGGKTVIFEGFNNVANGNNYGMWQVRLSNGLNICVGTLIIPNGQSVTVTFLVPYSNSAYAVATTANTAISDVLINYSNNTATSITFDKKSLDKTSNFDVNASFIIIGG